MVSPHQLDLEVYEIENDALDRQRAVLDAMSELAPWANPPRCEAGFEDVMRVLRPGGSMVVVDNDLRHGEFAELVVGSSWAEPQGTAVTTDAWWHERGASRTEVMSDWAFDSRRDMEAVLRLELPADIVDPWLAEHPERTAITYGYVLFAATKPKRRTVH